MHNMACSNLQEPTHMNTPAITLYGTPASGHAHRVELLLLLLELPYAYVEAPAPVRRDS